MFGERCYGMAHCGHSTNWSCACTCDEEPEYYTYTPKVLVKPITEVERLERLIKRLELYVVHLPGCNANDFDYLDKTPCTCRLREFYNPKGV